MIILIESDSTSSSDSEGSKIFSIYLNKKSEKVASSIPPPADYEEPEYARDPGLSNKWSDTKVHFVENDNLDLKPALKKKSYSRLKTPYREVKIHEGVFRRKNS